MSCQERQLVLQVADVTQQYAPEENLPFQEKKKKCKRLNALNTLHVPVRLQTNLKEIAQEKKKKKKKRNTAHNIPL